MSLLSSIGSSLLDAAFSGLSSNFGAIDYGINPLTQFGYDKLWSAQRNNSVQNALAAYNLQLHYLPKFVKGQRQALEAAGYNPIMAVNSAGGMPMSSHLPETGGLLSGSRTSAFMDNVAKSAMIEQTNAQTDFIKKRTLGEGWQIKTLSRSEAQGLGANLIHTLGFNFHDSSQDTFLVAYNPITGELRNLGDTSHGLGSTGPASNAAQVDVIPVDWHTDKSPRYKFNPDDWELKPEYRK